jgi:ABC-type sulfate transport system permease component
MNTIGLFFFISLVFSPLAAAMAYIITYEEYKKHLRKPQAVKQSLQMALFAFLVFMSIGIIVGFIFSNGIQ